MVNSPFINPDQEETLESSVTLGVSGTLNPAGSINVDSDNFTVATANSGSQPSAPQITQPSFTLPPSEIPLSPYDDPPPPPKSKPLTPEEREKIIEPIEKLKKENEENWLDKLKKKMFPYRGNQNTGGNDSSPPPANNSFHADFGDGHAADPGVAAATEAGYGGVATDNNFVWPVVLDLGGDGIEIVPLGQSRARFDIDGDGRRQLLAWVGPDDALLVYDRDGDRLITSRDEIAFRDYLAGARTDLEGLAWFDQYAQGGNEDGVLDERDAMWGDFGVWRDADQDGETDAGELRMSGEGGLSSVNLHSDGIPRDAGPDARVFGRGDFEVTDAEGNQISGDLYDVALRFVDEATEPRQPTRAEILYPTMAPAPKPMRRIRKDGEPLSRGEIFYPEHGNDDDYYFVDFEPEPEPEDREPTRAEILYPAEPAKPDLGHRVRRDGQPLSRAEILYPEGYPPEDYMFIKIAADRSWK